MRLFVFSFVEIRIEESENRWKKTENLRCIAGRGRAADEAEEAREVRDDGQRRDALVKLIFDL